MRLERLIAPHRPALALALLAALLYAPSAWLRDPWSPDEPRYAEVARVMSVRGDYLLPHLNGEVYTEKPPVFFWLGLLAERLPFVPAAGGTRLVAALSAWATLLLTFVVGRRLATPRAGWLAALILATSALFVQHAWSGVIDGLLTALVTAAIAAGLEARRATSPVLWAAFYLLAGVAVITKGPVGLLVPALVIWLIALQEDGRRGAFAGHALWGLLIAAIVAASWCVPAVLRGGREYAEVILLKQNVGRAYRAWHHREAIDYFLRVFPGSFLPWIAALPAALVAGAGGWRRHAGRRAALTWFAATFLFFSLVSGKKTRYLLPLFPAAALLVGIEIDRALAGAVRRARAAIPLGIVAALWAACGLALAAAPFGPAASLVAAVSHLAPDQREALLWYARPPGGLLLAIPGAAAAALGGAALARLRRDLPAALACCLASGLLLVWWSQWIGAGALDTVRSTRRLAERAEEAAGSDGEVITHRLARAEAFNLHMRRERIPSMADREETASWLRRRPGAVVLLPVAALAPLRARVGGLETIDCRRIGTEAVCAAQVGRPAGGALPGGP